MSPSFTSLPSIPSSPLSLTACSDRFRRRLPHFRADQSPLRVRMNHTGRLGAGCGEGIEEGRLPDIGKSDNAAVESHGGLQNGW
jgi:hypothetical protein